MLIKTCLVQFCKYSTANKSLLGKLRKATGYSISLCKEALQKNDDSYEQAEKWLHAEAQKRGLDKMNKFSSRTASEGLVGLSLKSRIASMVEINCETDFVSRTSVFQDLVSRISNELLCSSKPGSSTEFINMEKFGHEQLSTLIASTGETFSDLVALAVGTLGEKISLNRAVSICAPAGIDLYGCTHPSDKGNVGKFGAIIAVRSPETHDDIMKKLCLHVIGMKPSEVGSPDSVKNDNPDDESVLIHQQFLDDEECLVGEVLKEHNVEVVEFVRFECGGEETHFVKTD